MIIVDVDDIRNDLLTYPEELRKYGKEVWNTLRDNALDEFSLKAFELIEEVIPRDKLNAIMGEDFAECAVIILINILSDYVSRYSQEDENGDEIDSEGNHPPFFPEDAIRIVAMLADKVIAQDKTIENLEFAINYLNRGEKDVRES